MLPAIVTGTEAPDRRRKRLNGWPCSAGHFEQQRISAAGMDDVVGDTGNGKVAYNPDQQEDKVGGVRGAEESSAGALHLADVEPEHALLYFPDNAAEDIGDRQPQEDVDIPGDPGGEGMLKAVKDSEPEYERPQDR